MLASFTIDGHATSGTVEIRVPESEEVIVGDPHFFVGRSLYDWKQVRARVCVVNNRQTDLLSFFVHAVGIAIITSLSPFQTILQPNLPSNT